MRDRDGTELRKEALRRVEVGAWRADLDSKGEVSVLLDEVGEELVGGSDVHAVVDVKELCRLVAWLRLRVENRGTETLHISVKGGTSGLRLRGRRSEERAGELLGIIERSDVLKSESEKLALVELSRAAPLVIGVCDVPPSGRDALIVYANQPLCNWYGFRNSSEVHGKWAGRDLKLPESYRNLTIGKFNEAKKLKTAVRALMEAGKRVTDPHPRHQFEVAFAYLGQGDEGRDRFGFIGADVTESVRVSKELEEREQLLVQMADATTDILWVLDLSPRKFSYISPGIYRVLGLTPSEIEPHGFPLEKWTHPDDRAKVQRNFQCFERGENSFRCEYRVLRDNGEMRWIMDVGYVIEAAAGGPSRLAGVARDITEFKEAESALRANEERLRLAANSAHFGTYDFEIATGEALWSEELAHIFGRNGTRRVDADTALKVVHPDDRGIFQRIMRDALDPSCSNRHQAEYRIVRPDGSTRWVRDCGQTVLDEDDTPLRVVGLYQDITDQRDAERALIDADRRKDEFLAMLAHELRNPLSPIKTGLEILSMSPDDPERQARTRKIMSSQVDHLVRLVDDLLDVSRITRGRLTLRKERKPLKELVDLAVASVREGVNRRGHHLTVDIDNPYCEVEVDGARIAQVITNLLTNAVKFTPEGGRVSLKTRGYGAWVDISVTDSGVGIPEGDRERIFNLFQQAREDELANQGLGIGLTLVRSLVELHGGRVRVMSEGVNKGSTFEVRLPLPKETQESFDEVDATAVVQGEISGESRRVLIVDDNLEALELLQWAVENHHHEVATAENGMVAVDKTQSFHPEVVFLDLGMPVMDGFEAARAIRNLPGGDQITLVALTGWGQKAQRDNAKAAGFDHHLVKPCEIREVLEIIDSAECETQAEVAY